MAGADPTRCPRCSAPNGCAIAAAGGTTGDVGCWCAEVHFDPTVFDGASAAGHATCLCRACATGGMGRPQGLGGEQGNVDQGNGRVRD